MFKKIVKKLLHHLRISLGIVEMKTDMRIATQVAIESYIKSELRENPKYQDKKRLTSFEYQLFSQFGEDGIIAEIFKRIGTTNKIFVEIGAADGIENNTTNLLTNDWKGVWIEGDEDLVTTAKNAFNKFIQRGSIKIICKFITTANISSIIKSTKINKEFDLLSIDIDGNDYWIWEALKGYKPRVVVIEYNASLGATADWVMHYDENHRYDYSNYHGASLTALERLGKKLGYQLVGCSFSGVNAFFVRKDLVKNKFFTLATPEMLYESPKYFLYRRPGHPMNNKIFDDYNLK